MIMVDAAAGLVRDELLQRLPSRPLRSTHNLQHNGLEPLNCFGISSASRLHYADGMRVEPSEFNDVTGRILAAAIEVHRILGPGLLESIYTPCLQFELSERKLRFVAQRSVPIVYKGVPMDAAYRIDLMVEDVVVVEVKSVAAVLPVHQAQVLTYMQLTGCPLGLLINFNVPRLMEGVKRLINPRATVKRRTEVTEGTD
jgi:GxxExxY protein